MSSAVARGVSFMTLASLVFMVSGYIINLLLGRILGPADYGVYSVLIALMNVVNIVQTNGIPKATARFIAVRPGDGRQLLGQSLVMQAVITACISIGFALAAGLIARTFNDEGMQPYVVLTAAIFPIYGFFSVYMGYHNGLRNFGRQARMHITYSVTKVLAIIPLTLLYGLPGTLIGFVIAPVPALLSGIVRPRFAKVLPYQAWALFAVPVVIFTVLSTLLLGIDLFFLKSMSHDDRLAGYYAAAQNIAYITFYGLSAFAAVIMPNIAHLVKDGKDYSKARQLIERTLRLQLMIVLLLAAIIAGTRYELVHLLYSAEYAPASQALGILAFGIASLTIFTMLANVLNGSGRPVPPMVVGALGLVVTIIMCSLLIPGHGMIGAAWATAVGSTLALVAVWALVFRQFSVRIRFLTVCRLGLAAAVAYWLAVMVAQSLWLLPLAGILALIGYGATLLLTAEVRTDEVKGLISRL